MSTPRITILSPHQDDAAFSLADAIGRLVAGGAWVGVLNGFTRTEHAPYRTPGDGRPAAVVRAAEDRAAAAVLGIAGLTDLGFDDAPLRLGVALDGVCDPALPVGADLVAALARAVVDRLAGGTVLLAPLAGPGAHVDHRAARAAAVLAAATVPTLLLAFYEDLPYAARPGGAERPPDLVPVTVWSRDDGHAKRAVAALYASQLAPGELDVDDVLDAGGRRRGYAERLWVRPSERAVWAARLGT